MMMFESNKKSATHRRIFYGIFLGAFQGYIAFIWGRTEAAWRCLLYWWIFFDFNVVFIGFLTIWISPIWVFIDLFTYFRHGSRK